MVMSNDKKTKIVLVVMGLSIASTAPVLKEALEPLMGVSLSGNFTVGTLFAIAGLVGMYLLWSGKLYKIGNRGPGGGF